MIFEAIKKALRGYADNWRYDKETAMLQTITIPTIFLAALMVYITGCEIIASNETKKKYADAQKEVFEENWSDSLLLKDCFTLRKPQKEKFFAYRCIDPEYGVVCYKSDDNLSCFPIQN